MEDSALCYPGRAAQPGGRQFCRRLPSGKLSQAGFRFSQKQSARIHQCFQRLAPLLDAVKQPRFIHGDLWRGNILVSKTGELTAIIDCDRALFGDPAFELATGWMIDANFLGGYGRQPDASPEAVLRRRLYKLLLDLEDCYFLRHEYDNPTASEELAPKILSAVAELEAAF